jgi:hypothetical protein
MNLVLPVAVYDLQENLSISSLESIVLISHRLIDELLTNFTIEFVIEDRLY